MKQILEFFRTYKDSWDPVRYFTKVGWSQQAHNEAIAEVGSFESTLAANKTEYADFPNLQADKNALHEEWLPQYQIAYSAHLQEIKRAAREMGRQLDEQATISDADKKEIRRMLKI